VGLWRVRGGCLCVRERWRPALSIHPHPSPFFSFFPDTTRPLCLFDRACGRASLSLLTKELSDRAARGPGPPFPRPPAQPARHPFKKIRTPSFLLSFGLARQRPPRRHRPCPTPESEGRRGGRRRCRCAAEARERCVSFVLGASAPRVGTKKHQHDKKNKNLPDCLPADAPVCICVPAWGCGAARACALLPSPFPCFFGSPLLFFIPPPPPRGVWGARMREACGLAGGRWGWWRRERAVCARPNKRETTTTVGERRL
jgi:hypothetical protein